MLAQTGLRKNLIHRKFGIGPHPIIQHYLDLLRVEETIGAFISRDARQILSVEKTLCVLVHNILTSAMPLYEIADWVTPLNEESLGLELGEASKIQDDRVGYALDKFYDGRHKDVFFRLTLRAIKMFGLDCSQIHQDTTTVTFSGQYRGWRAHEFLTYGKNKDHRPDLKQLVLGLSVTADGSVPLLHQIYSGNQTDDRLHPENHRQLRKLLSRSDFIYVADSKLATEENLEKIILCGGRVISIMPRTWKEDEVFREKVRKGQVSWSHLLSRKNNRRPDSKMDEYRLADGEYRTSQGYLLLWIHSSQKAEQDQETRQRHLQKAMGSLRELQGKLNRYSLKTAPAIKKAVKNILKECQCKDLIAYQVHTHHQYHVKHQKRGRPSLKSIERGKKTWTSFFSLSFHLDDSALKREQMTDGVFPLITNIEGEEYPPRRILEIYKFQPFLEKRNSQLKTWQEITPVLLKKSERVVALLHIHVMALMVATLIERKLRLAMRKNKIQSLPIYPESRQCKFPTVFDVVRLFRGVERYEVEGDGPLQIFPATLSPIQKQVLNLLEVPVSLYQ